MKRVRHWRGHKDLGDQLRTGGNHKRGAHGSGTPLRRSREGKLYFTLHRDGRYARYVVTKKGERWLEARGLQAGSHINGATVKELFDVGHIQLSPSLTPSRARNRKPGTSSAKAWNWAESVDYEARIGPSAGASGPPRSSTPEPTDNSNVNEPSLMEGDDSRAEAPAKPPYHGVPARLQKKARKRNRGKKR